MNRMATSVDSTINSIIACLGSKLNIILTKNYYQGNYFNILTDVLSNVAEINELWRSFLHDTIEAENLEVVDGLHQRTEHPCVELRIAPQQTGLILIRPANFVAAN